MDSRKLVLLVGALFVAGLTAFFARSMIAGGGAPGAGASVNTVVIDGPEVLVATRALPVGTILDATALKYQPWPKQFVDNAYFLRAKTDLHSLQGTVVRNAITAGQPVTQGALVKPGDRGFLAAALGPGMRAVTFPVSAQSAVAGFVFPGDRIDLVMTQSVSGGGDGSPLKVSETIMRNLRVLATDQRTDNVVGDDGKTQVKTFGSVTVEATPKISEQIAVAQTVGSLSVSLRSIADNASQLEESIASGRVKLPAGAGPKAQRAMLAQVASQPEGGSSSFATGADISHFQRSTVPGKANSAQVAIDGPVVRVARGNIVEVVPVGQNNRQVMQPGMTGGGAPGGAFPMGQPNGQVPTMPPGSTQMSTTTVTFGGKN